VSGVISLSGPGARGCVRPRVRVVPVSMIGFNLYWGPRGARVRVCWALVIYFFTTWSYPR
jgi:hypothetical protein